MTQAVHCGCDSVSPYCGMEAHESSYHNDSAAKSLRSGFHPLPSPQQGTPLVSFPTGLNLDLANRPALTHFCLGFLSRYRGLGSPPPSGVSEQIKGEGIFCRAKDCVASRPQKLSPPCF